MGAVMRYWKRRCTLSWVRISSGIGSPLAIVMTRVVPSTVEDTMPGNHSWIRDGSPMRAHTSSGGRAMVTWRRTLPRGGVISASCRGRRDEVGDHLGELGTLVLLEEVAAAFDGPVRLALCAGHDAEELALAALGDRVAVAERAQERFVEGP